jgi:hypothetical protein
MNTIKTMKINATTHERLKRFARKDETFDDVITRLLDSVDGSYGNV